MTDRNQVRELISRSRHNDTIAFARLVSEYQEMVFRLAFRLLCHEDEAKDMVQEVFVRIWQSLDKYDEAYCFSTWIYKITCNICYDRLRVLYHSPSALGCTNVTEICNLQSEENIESVLVNRELKELILRFTQELTPKQKIVFTLRDIEELEVEEVITITGMTADNIKHNLYHARKYIRTKINQMNSDI